MLYYSNVCCNISTSHIAREKIRLDKCNVTRYTHPL